MEFIKAVDKSNPANEVHAFSSFGDYIESMTSLPKQTYSKGTEFLYLKELADEELIKLFTREKNEEAFNEIVERYTDIIYRLALKITRNHSDAEVVLQEVFLTLIEKVSTFLEQSKFSTWLYRITVNTSFEYLRAEKRYKSNMSLDDYAPYDENGSLNCVEIKDWSNTPDEAIISRETIEIIEKAVSEIPEKYRVVFHLRDVEGLTNQEVAEVLGLSLPAVKSRILRARFFLRDKLSDYFYEWNK
ncbi:MAG: RNA polymerase sigma factor [Thermodesulfobacteriota bacterium]